MNRIQNPASRWVHCQVCDKRGYYEKSAAKKARSQMPKGERLAIYKCPENDDLYHIGRSHYFHTRQEQRNYHDAMKEYNANRKGGTNAGRSQDGGTTQDGS